MPSSWQPGGHAAAVLSALSPAVRPPPLTPPLPRCPAAGALRNSPLAQQACHAPRSELPKLLAGLQAQVHRSAASCQQAVNYYDPQVAWALQCEAAKGKPPPQTPPPEQVPLLLLGSALRLLGVGQAEVQAEEESRTCLACGATSAAKMQRCSRCLVARYCSEACQRGHWRLHKKDCAALGAAAAKGRRGGK